MNPVVVEKVPVVTEDEIKKIVENMDFDVRCLCPEGTYTGVCCTSLPYNDPTEPCP